MTTDFEGIINVSKIDPSRKTAYEDMGNCLVRTVPSRLSVELQSYWSRS